MIWMTFKAHRWMILAILLILIYLSPLLILGKDSHVRVHDSLDSAVIWYQTLAHSGKIFAPHDATIPNMMNGLPRISLGSPFELILWLFVWFPPFVAYTINALIVRFVAFFGMYLLLNKFVLRTCSEVRGKRLDLKKSEKRPISTFKNQDQLIEAGVALCFALLPYWLPGSLSIAGIPLAAYAFLNIRKRQDTLKDWIILLILPIASSFVLTYLFFLGAMGVLWLMDWIQTKKPNMKMFAATAGMTVLFLAIDYRLVIGILFGQGFTPHRVEFDLGHNTFARTFGLAWENFTTAHTHAYTLQYDVIIFIAGLCVFWILMKKILAWRNPSGLLLENEKKLLRLLILAACFSLWYAFWYWQGFRILKDHFDIANTFNFSRIHFLNAVLWYLIFAVSLGLVMKKGRALGQPTVLLLLICQLFVVFNQNHEIKYRRLHMPSWREYYSPKLFSSIQHYIGKNPADYRVVSLGMHPAISQYNGFYTLDLYTTLYPLHYKHQFRKIIAPELAKNHTIKAYFDRWGSRCYIFSAELGKYYFYTKSKHKVVHNLDLNTKVLKNMGGDYILSAVKIANAKKIHLKLLHIFENQTSIWKIYLYQVNG